MTFHMKKVKCRQYSRAAKITWEVPDVLLEKAQVRMIKN